MHRIITACLPLLIIVLLVGNGCSSQNEDDFGIYLLTDNIPSNQVTSFDFKSVELQNMPLISIDDIITYSWDTHEIQLTDDAGGRISSISPPMTGTPFVVCVGNEHIYSGALWSVYSSVLSEGAVIYPFLAGMKHTIQISVGPLYSEKDPRSDSRIFDSLEHAGKLTGYQ